MSKKQQEKKKKQREIIAKKRVEARRKILLKEKQEKNKAAKLERKFRTKVQPIIKDKNKMIEFEENKQEKIKNQINKNIEILKGLENEYLKEQEYKKQFNQELEAEGHVTLKEKLEALNLKAKDSMSDEEIETGLVDRTENQENKNEC
jgi:hypothetical protein